MGSLLKNIKRHDDSYEKKPVLYCPFSTGMRVTSKFGWRWGRKHRGVDVVPANTGNINIFSPGWMKCIRTGYDSKSGNYMVLTSLFYPEQLTLKFMHLDKLFIKNNKIIEAKTLIAHMGNTGHSTGAHLHLEVWYPSSDGWQGKPIDPIKNVKWLNWEL